ncbi:TetR/AcrR family transcriptional regulator [Actinokineospora guangxiensis]|uniref:TetR/AcrR family transcriptional regulator n=1 Tax=Actinokineospora guangxiensis TaxID=1490288 RepID=A0ABW0EW55_9PSEU
MPRAGLTADKLVAAGAELADEAGFGQVTVAALAKRFGVAAASLYSHVGGTGDLRTRVALLALDELADRAADAVAGRAGRDALAALADAYREYAEAHPGRYAATRHRLDPATAAASAGPRHAALTRAVLRGYGLAEPETTHAVRFVGATVHGFLDLSASGSFAHSEPHARASWTRALDALDAALRAWPTP